MGFNLTGNEIKNTYQRLVTISGSVIANGTGSDITNLTVTASNATTASFAQTANSSSYALTASFALNVPVTASYAISASQAQNAVNANNATSASFASTAASAATAISASYALSASQAQNAITANSATSASYALSASRSETSNAAATAVSASHAVTASFALSSVAANTGSLLITGSVSNATLVFTKGDNSTFPLTVNNVSNASTASIATTASFATTAATAATATSASFATTASFALNVVPINTGSFYVSSSVNNATITFNQGDGTTEAVTVNNVSNASTASIATTAASASYVANAVLTGSSSANSFTFTKFDGSQFTLSVQTGSGFPFVGDAQVTGSLNVSGSITLKSGSFSGSLVDNITDIYSSPDVEHIVTLTQAEYNAIGTPDANTFYIITDGGGVSTSQFATTGSNTFIGNQTITGSLAVSGGITGSLLGTASFVSTASFATTANFADTAGAATFANNATSASYAVSASFATTASFATSASFAPSTPAFPFTGSARITGSLTITGSNSTNFNPVLTWTRADLGESGILTTNSNGAAVYGNRVNGLLYLGVNQSGQQDLIVLGAAGAIGFYGLAGSSTAFSFYNDMTNGADFRRPLKVSGSLTVTGSTAMTGSLTVTGSLTQNTGYVVLTQVSQSLNYVDDTAAAAGGVPLGGLYRNGNAIMIRLV